MGIELLRPFYDIEINVGILVGEHPSAIRHPLELLLDPELVHPVEVDVRRGVQEEFLDGVITVQRDVQAAREAVTLAVYGHEGEIHTFISGNVHRIHDIIFVIGDGQRGRQRAHETVQQDIDIVVEDIDALEYLPKVGGDGASIVQGLVDTLLALGLGDRLLRLGMFAVVLVGDRLTDGDRQDRFPVELRGIQIVLDELEFLQELILLEIGVEVVQRHAELLVHLALVLVLRLDAVVVLMLYDFLDQFHGGVVLAGIFLTFRLDDYLGNLERGRPEEHVEGVVLLPRL